MASQPAEGEALVHARVAEPSAKRLKKMEEEQPAVKEESTAEGSGIIPGPESSVDSFFERQATAMAEHSRDELIDGLFEAWDKDGNGSLSFEEILPHYMKCAHHNVLEPDVRHGFEQFMESQGKKPSEGITPALFHKWLSKLTDEQVANHYVRHVQGWTGQPYRMNFELAVVKEYHHKSLKEILDAPAHALRGLSEHGEGALAPLGLHTVRDVGAWRCFILARAICALAAREILQEDRPPSSETHEPLSRHVNIRNALIQEHEAEPLKHVLDLPVSAFSMFPEQGDTALQRLRIKTIRHLGTRKYFQWANAMLELENFEA